MSNETVFELVFDVFLMFIGVQAILNEQKLVKFERKAKKHIKAFFKAIYLSIKEKRESKNVEM